MKIKPEMAEVFNYFIVKALIREGYDVKQIPKGSFEQSKQEFFDRHI